MKILDMCGWAQVHPRVCVHMVSVADGTDTWNVTHPSACFYWGQEMSSKDCNPRPTVMLKSPGDQGRTQCRCGVEAGKELLRLFEYLLDCCSLC